MMSPLRVLGAILVASATTVGQGSSSSSGSRSYDDVIELYRIGQEQAAVEALRELKSKDVAAGREALLASGAASTMRLAALLHTENAFSLRLRGNSLEFSNQIYTAIAYIKRLESRDRTSAFVQTWWLMVIAFCHRQFAVSEAKGFAARARESVSDTPELLLAYGATDEMEWAERHEADGFPGVKGDLKEAERDYRNALTAEPDLVEARLRLGRVLSLRGEPEALTVLEQIGDGTDDGFRYLARLFEGDAIERQGDLAAARRQYLAAIALFPTAQSAHVALAHLQHVLGARTEAAAEMRIITQNRVTRDTADPWFWYTRGMSWHADVYLDALLKFARQ